MSSVPFLSALGAVLLAALSAYLGYYAGWAKDQREIQRRRVALAQALLVELLWLEHTLTRISAEAQPAQTRLRLSTFIFEKFSQELLSFRVATLRALLRAYASVNQLRGSLSREDSDLRTPEQGATAIRTSIKAILEHIYIARMALIDGEQGQLPEFMYDERDYFYPDQASSLILPSGRDTSLHRTPDRRERG